MCLCCVAAVRADDWPHWHGPSSNGVADVLRAPERWSDTEGVVWRTQIEGSGNSSPVIVGHRAYVTTAISWERRTALRVACDYLLGCLALFGAYSGPS